MKTVSFVIPCYRSEHTLPHVTAEIVSAMEHLRKYQYEIILINDCSPDHTMDTIRRLCAERDNIRGISFAKNFGQHAALMAGFRIAKGDYVVCLDDDGQTPANEVGKLLVKLEEGYDAVYARYDHKKHNAFRNLGSRLNERMTRIMLDKPPALYLSSYFAVQRFIVEDMIQYEHSYPYVIGLVLRATQNITNVSVSHREREEGASGYTLKKLLSLWFNGFTAFSVKPLRFATIVGSISAGVGFLFGIYTIIKRFILPEIPMGYSATMSALVFFGGMIMIMLGLIGEYIGRIYISMNHYPQYVVREKINIRQNHSFGHSYKGDQNRSERKKITEGDAKQQESRKPGISGSKQQTGKKNGEYSSKQAEVKKSGESSLKQSEVKKSGENNLKQAEVKKTGDSSHKPPEGEKAGENSLRSPDTNKSYGSRRYYQGRRNYYGGRKTTQDQKTEEKSPESRSNPQA
jgi:undecaprenyl-phosphate 4-deoxy-4-formamido-L-arabinose transferase